MLTLSSGPTSMPLVAGQSSNNSLPNAAFLIEKVYPNPTTDVLNVELEIGAESDAILQIANVQGATIEQFDFNLEKGKNNLRIEVATLARGVYFLKIETESGVMIERFLKE